jgi:hypothetical protein
VLKKRLVASALCLPFGGTPYTADTPLPASGLIGPVRLVQQLKDE